VEALREGLADGTIDIVATDHAPHPAEAKECEWQEAAFGMLGLESALSIINQVMVAPGLMSWEAVAERMSHAPARIGRYEQHGQKIAIGSVANLTMINPKQTMRIDRDLVASRSRNTPFHGMELQGAIQGTFYQGHPTYLNSKLTAIEGR
jgi:dihydroorotase